VPQPRQGRSDGRKSTPSRAQPLASKQSRDSRGYHFSRCSFSPSTRLRVALALPRIVQQPLHGAMSSILGRSTIYLPCLRDRQRPDQRHACRPPFGRSPRYVDLRRVPMVPCSLGAGRPQHTNMEMFILFRAPGPLAAARVFPRSPSRVVADLYTPPRARPSTSALFRRRLFGVLSRWFWPPRRGFIHRYVPAGMIFYINIPIGLISLFILWRTSCRAESLGRGGARTSTYLGPRVCALAIRPRPDRAD